MRKADLSTAALLAALGGIVVVDSVRLGIGWGTDGPKSGFFPFWLAVLMILACAGILAQAVRRRTDKPFVTREQFGPVLWVLLPATAFVLLTGGIPEINIPGIGLYVAAAVYLAFYMRKVGGHHWSLVVLLALGIPIATFLIFEKWFLVPMPKGPLETWLGY